ncbi:MAG: alpha/beta hydrolase fold domain-containing protein [Williamsia sp.]|nr:alpha/beta hydrolase fold domain-containing protein [Williamsia sp.]
MSKPLAQYFLTLYLSNPAEGANPLISLVNANLSGLPSTTIINAETDPLLSDGGQLANKLQEAKVLFRQVYTGVTQEFFGMVTVVREAKEAQAFAAQRFKQVLGNWNMIIYYIVISPNRRLKQ